MSDQKKAPRSGRKAQPHVDRSRIDQSSVGKCGDEAMLTQLPQSIECSPNFRLSDAVGVSTSVRPGRNRNRSSTELEEKIKKPAEDVRKKSPPARKAPSRGRYVDEYARPSL